MNACVQVEIEYNSSIPDGLVASLERIADEHQVKLTVTSSRRLHTSDHPPSAQRVVHVSQPRLRVTSSSSSDCQPAAKKRKV